MSGTPRRLPRGVVAVACGLLVLLAFGAISELVLPSLAERRLRNSLSENAKGVSVDVTAEPAIKLLFGHADRVRVDIREMRSGRGNLPDLLARTARTDRLDARVGSVVTHGLRIDDVSLRKRGSMLTARATVTRAAIKAILPAAIRIDQRAAASNTLAFKATLRALGKVVRVTALVQARNGRLLLAPDSVLGGVLSVTLFGDPRVYVDFLDSSKREGGRYVFTVRGHLT